MTTTTLTAYHGDHNLKDQTLTKIRAHQQAVVCHQVEHGLSEDTPTARENAAIAASRRMADIVLAPLTAAAAEEERDGLA